MTQQHSAASCFLSLPATERLDRLSQLSEIEQALLLWDWGLWGRPSQLLPGGDWTYWLIKAGRGWGKTRTGAEAVRQWVADGHHYVNLIGATADDARDIMVQGESGILAICPVWERPEYKPSQRKLVWPNGAESLIFTADEPDRLRGKQSEKMWCLAGDTNVLMADGSERHLDTLSVGDFVMTRKGARRVMAAVQTHREAQVYRMIIKGGRDIIGTADHPVFVVGAGFVPLASLNRGDRVCVANVSYGVARLKIVSVRKLATRIPVYDIAVSGEREFFANGILVHNCDELAAWRYAESWDQAQFGLRLGANPQAVITTTPRPTKLVRAIMADPATVVTHGSTHDNRANLAGSFFSAILKKYEGTRLGRQEIAGEVLDDNPGALFKRADIDKGRLLIAPQLQRVVVAIDPAATSTEGADDTGIVVAGVADVAGVSHGYILADATLHATPDGWANAAVKAYRDAKADRIVAEVNNGGEMVEAVIRAVDRNVPVRKVTATRGKAIRAEPVAALYEQGRIHHIGHLAALEDQMIEWSPDDASAKSPDRMDALVWALTDLMLADQTTGALDYYRNLAARVKTG